MNGAAIGGRQRSSHHHQRQYSSDHFLIDPASSSNATSKWAQSSSQPVVEYSRMLRSMQRGMSGEFLMSASAEPSTPPLSSRSSSQRKNGDDISPSELSPGLLDLHSFDTELLPEMAVPGLYDGGAPFGYARGKNFDDSDLSFNGNKQISKARVVPENNLLKSFSVDKEKLGFVAKIKVVVRKRPLNKKEISKKEEDIITIEPYSSSLTVHETKLKSESDLLDAEA